MTATEQTVTFLREIEAECRWISWTEIEARVTAAFAGLSARDARLAAQAMGRYSDIGSKRRCVESVVRMLHGRKESWQRCQMIDPH